MKFSTLIMVLFFCFCAASVGQTNANSEDFKIQQTAMENVSRMPIAFTENQGQWPDSILFRANAGGAITWFTKTGVYHQFIRKVEGNREKANRYDPTDHIDEDCDSIEIMMIKAEFVGGNLNPSPRGKNMMDYRCNYFLGNDPDKWRTDVPNYEEIVLEDVYSGIDLRYYSNGNHVEYDFKVHPGADYTKIQIRYKGGRKFISR